MHYSILGLGQTQHRIHCKYGGRNLLLCSFAAHFVSSLSRSLASPLPRSPLPRSIARLLLRLCTPSLLHPCTPTLLYPFTTSPLHSFNPLLLRFTPSRSCRSESETISIQRVLHRVECLLFSGHLLAVE